MDYQALFIVIDIILFSSATQVICASRARAEQEPSATRAETTRARTGPFAPVRTGSSGIPSSRADGESASPTASARATKLALTTGNWTFFDRTALLV
jgi:hypothetical protein